VLVFGEDENDTKAIRELIVALCPELESRIETRRRPLVLIKDARPEDVPDRARQIADVVAAERRRRNVLCVFAHQDCDDVEPSHEAIGRKIEDALERAGCHVHAVTPAWEIETWWFLWPAAVRAYQSSWKLPTRYFGADVGLIVNAKEELRRAVLAPGDRRPRRYRESDSPLLAKKVREMGIVRNPEAKSLSYERFVGSVDACCSRVSSATAAR